MSTRKSRALRLPGFGVRVTSKLAEGGWKNQGAFAAEAGLPPGQVSKYASGTVPGSENLGLLAKGLGVSWEWLLVGRAGGQIAARGPEDPPEEIIPTVSPPAKPARPGPRRIVQPSRPAGGARKSAG